MSKTLYDGGGDVGIRYRLQITRDFFLGFIKIHILYHASVSPISGVELMKELRRHGYLVSPGVVYPTLRSLERHGYLKRENRSVHGKVRKYYALTDRGSRMLSDARRKIRELVGEVMR